ncbi:PssD/Cps14F family polysaccharide biosynthesis glycosyltransferase [Vibrio breoganii]
MVLEKKIFLIYGEGGHKAQMNRLISGLGIDRSQFYHVVDYDIKHDNRSFALCPMRLKVKTNFVFSLFYILHASFVNFFKAVRIYLEHKPDVIVSTGPLIFFFFFVFAKFSNTKTIYIETWSRFYSRSMSGRIAYLLSDVFYYQNEELKVLYPHGIYSGRL